MKRFIENWKNIFLLPALAAPMLAGCSDDFNPGRGGDGDFENGVVVYVPGVMKDLEPAPSTRTRGELNDFQADEGEIKSLHLFAYAVSGDAAPKVIDLTQAEPSENAPEGYEGYKLEIDPGSYRLYVVANVSFTNPSTLSEEDLKNYPVSAPGSAKAGLPMSCANSGMMVQYNGESGYTSVTDAAGINMASGAAVKVKADLKFAVAKVRVTMLNDMRPGLELDNSALDNLADVSSLMPGGQVAVVNTISGEFAEAGYYELPEMKEDLLKVQVDQMTPVSTPGDTWAWQGTTYVAERLFDDEAADKSAVTLTLSDGVTKVLPIGTADEGLKRSYFYDYVGNSKGEFKLDVQPWDPVTIAGSLHGPYFLHVDETAISIEAGEQTSLRYESNAQIECISNTYTLGDDTEIPIYNFTIEDNEIKISVNPEIKGNMLDAVKAENGWKNFTIKAGTIIKRIEVKELDLHEFLTVDTENLTIDVREQIASGIYSGTFIIPIRTNLDSFTITPSDNWPAGTEITLCDPDGQPIGDLSNIAVPAGGVYNLQLKFSGLNDGIPFWQATSQMQFTVSGTPTVGDPVELPVTVNVLASTDDYIIHLYAPGWTLPHIYVYQSLELPASHPLYPNAPVGTGGKYDDNGVQKEYEDAALEYGFTAGIAFKGWNVATDGVNYNDPTAGGSVRSSTFFFVFDEAPTAGDWRVSSGDGWKKHYYDIDFCSEYRKQVSCGDCQNSIQRGWPGIAMISEGNGWWKFTLSGIATPGKALIMFADGHGGDGTKRYPASNQPGIPLFDYPSREGWFDYTSSTKQFSPNAPVPPATTDVTIYYKGSNGNVPKDNTVYLNIDGTRKQMTQTTLAGNSDWWVVKASVPENASTMRFDSYQSDEWKTADYKNLISDISNYGTTLYYEFQSWNVVRVNAPSEGGGDSDEYVTYRIAWPYNYSGINRNKIYCYSGLPDGTKVGKEGDASLQNQDYEFNDRYNNEAYFVFRVPSNAGSWTITNVWIKREGGGEDGDYSIPVSSFQLYEGSDIPTYKITSF